MLLDGSLARCLEQPVVKGVAAAMMRSRTSRRPREHSGNADGRNKVQICVQIVAGSEMNDHAQARRTLKRPWRARGVPTPQSVRSSNPRFKAPACSSTRFRMLS
jgi:hypothetical protein